MKMITLAALFCVGFSSHAFDLGCFRAKELMLSEPNGTFADRLSLKTHVVAPLNPQVEQELLDFLNGDRKGTLCLEGSSLQFNEYFVWKTKRGDS